MIKNYFKIAWRNLVKNKSSAFINISGLAVGMTVAMLIGLWIWDELSFNKQFDNYGSIAQVMQNQTFNGEVGSQIAVPWMMADELRKTYGNDFKSVSMSSWTYDHTLSFGQKKVTKSGNFFEPQITSMLSLKLISGVASALSDKSAVLLSKSVSTAIFGNENPMDKMLKIDNKYDVKVAGVYEDLPSNSNFGNLTFIAAWQLYIDSEVWPEKFTNAWRSNAFLTYVQLADNADMKVVSDKIKNVKLNRVQKTEASYKPVVFLQPMRNWHLYNEFKNGVNVGGRIQFVWLFGIIGAFVLLLACINFMNLSTAKSEKRAKEVGIRKAIGSLRGQLIKQFFSESLMVAAFAFVLSLIAVQIVLPFFNEMADKKMTILWTNPLFWLCGIVFIVFTGLLAGSYPALYLSSFQPVKVLKGTFRAGRFANTPRKVLVVLQFSVSIILIIGTIIVFKQIEFAKNRPVGYNRNRLMVSRMETSNIHDHFDAVRTELINSGAVDEMAESSSTTTYIGEVDNGFEWKGKAPSTQGNLGVVFTSFGFGKTIDWQLIAGRDFSTDYITDSSGIILNETAAKFMNLEKPVGEVIKWEGKDYQVIGVVKDLVMQSPYEPVFRTVFVIDKASMNFINLKLNSLSNTHDALSKIEPVFKKYNPDQPFDYKFIDDEYAQKFSDEERIGKLANVFAVLAIFISCLGLFGMASFMAEQRTKEIGVRKVLGASVFNLWRLLSKDFVSLLIISLCIAIPIAYYFMHGWLQNYTYHTVLSWWIFAAAAIGAFFITILTISFQTIKAAMANPIKSLRTE
jgi:putative ABC transport system permease protein